MSTVVQYNGIELHNVLTREWHQEIVYDNSKTDKLYNKFRITVEGICHNQIPFSQQSWSSGQSVFALDGNNPANLAGMQALIVSTLGVSRKHFKMFVESSDIIPEIVLLEADGGAAVSIPILDTDNGPKPSKIEIKEIVGNRIFKVVFTIEICLSLCNIERYTPFVLSNRWSVGETMDENFFTTRTIRGRMRLAFSTFDNGSTVPAHAVKSLAIPPLEDGFKRQSIDFVATENQLEAEYMIVDRQVHKASPWPATKMEVTHSTGTSDGLTARAECQVRLEGTPMTPSILLMIRAIQILELRLGITDLKQGTDYLVEDANFVNYIGEKPAVEARMRIGTITKFQNVTSANSPVLLKNLILACGWGDFTDSAGKMLLKPLPGYENFPYNEKESPTPTVYGYDPMGAERSPVNLFILHCYQQTPCDAKKGINQASLPSGTTTENPTPDRTKVQGYSYPSSSLPEGQKSLYSPGTETAIYTYCACESTYSTNALRIQMPIASDPATANAEDSTCKIVQLGPKQTTREIVLHYERKGSMPSIPEPVDVYQNGTITGTLLKHWETFYPPQLTNDGSGTLYRVDAHYIYALNRPPLKTENIDVGILPYVNKESEEIKNSVKRTEFYGTDGQVIGDPQT